MWRNRLAVITVLMLIIVGLSACYKDAGEDVQPTSNQVNLTDIAPYTPTQPGLPTLTGLPTTPTRTIIPSLVPTTTPPGSSAAEVEPVAMPTTSGQPTNTPMQIAPSFTPAIVNSPTPAGPVIQTPGLSDIKPSNTPLPTRDPNDLSTPTPLPAEDNPCIYLIQPNDTLYSIAQNNSVLLPDLVAVNTDLLWAGQNTPLQIGWELDIPGCTFGEPSPTPAITGTAGSTPPAATPAPGGQTIHTVQSGETIFSIGRLYGVDPHAIISTNGLVNPDLLQPGQQLIIP